MAGESGTTNNCSSSVTVTVRQPVQGVRGPVQEVLDPAPDLVVDSPTVSDGSPAAGTSFTLSATVSNTGDGESPPTTLRYYRSVDGTITPSDRPEGTAAVGALAAAGTSSLTVSLTAPSNPGTYYYGACVDTVAGESDPTNNCSLSVRVTVSVSEPVSEPNLVVGSPAVSDRTPWFGTDFTLSATVSNTGGAASPSTTLRYYRSTDATITRSDTEVGTATTGALAAAGTSSRSITVTAQAIPGTWYYGACVDEVTGESNTTDNCSLSVRVNVGTGPDLVVQDSQCTTIHLHYTQVVILALQWMCGTRETRPHLLQQSKSIVRPTPCLSANEVVATWSGGGASIQIRAFEYR